MKPKAFLILIVAAGALVGLAVWSASPDKSVAKSSDAESPRFLPRLAEQAKDVSSITVKRPELTFTIQRGEGGVWTVPDKADYPAKPDTVRGALVGLSELREWEPRTDRPDLYSKLGVEDPVAPPPEKSADKGLPQSTLVTLKDAKGAVIAEVILGNRKYGSGASDSGTYVRRSGDARSWLAKGTAEVPRDILSWLDAQFANIERSRVKGVTINHPGAPPLVASRETSVAAFAVQGIPPGRELKDPGIADTIASCLTMTSFQDVAKQGSIDFTGGPDGKPGPTAEVRCFDGLVVTVNSVAKEGRQWWKLTAAADHSVIEANATGDPEKIKAETEKLNKEVQELNAKWSPFVFAPIDYKARALNNTLDDMLKPPAAPQPTPGAPTPPGAGDKDSPGTPPSEPEPKPDE